jgi:hypothetical protein
MARKPKTGIPFPKYLSKIILCRF